jgi:hypothetical protein
MYLQQKNSNTTYSGGVHFFSYKQMLAREREQIKENILVTNEDERGCSSITASPTNGLCVSGNVLIGKTDQSNSNYLLDVAGPIRANEIDVNTTGADFVFEKDYQLKSISELEQFINKNKHLPDIPSANEVQKNGVELGKMNTILLQKIEELTLYIIELQKQVEELKSKSN